MLRQMSDTLSHARHLTFTATRRLDATLAENIGMPESSTIEVAVSRPQMLRGRMVSKDDARTFYADGRSITLVDEHMKLYATEPVAGTIDEMVEALDAQFGFTPPLAEFVLNDPFQKFNKLIERSAYQGQEAIEGQACDHLSLTGPIADAEVWIARANHLPRRFIATFKDREGGPRLTLDFADWNLAATLDDSLFVFVPPAGTAKTTMVATADTESAEGKRMKEKGGSK
jgi:hypothetical protein